MGGMDGIMGMLPGMGKMKKQMAEAGFDDSDASAARSPSSSR